MSDDQSTTETTNEPTGESTNGTSVARRTVLRMAAVAGGVGATVPLSASRASATQVVENQTGQTDGGESGSLVTGIHQSSIGLNEYTLVVYSDAVEDERTVCGTDVSWRHSVVALPLVASRPVVYTELATANRYSPGTCFEVVDRLSACPTDSPLTLVFMAIVSSPQ